MLLFFILLFVLLLKQHLEYARTSVDPSTSADRLHVLLRATCYISSPLPFDSMCRSSKIMARFYAATPVWTLVGSIGATLTVRFLPTTRFNRLKIKTFFEWATEDDEVDECWCYLGYSYRTGRSRWLAISSNASAWEAKSFHRRLSAFICLMTHGNEHTTKNRRRRRRGGPGWVAISGTKPPNEEKNGNFTTGCNESRRVGIVLWENTNSCRVGFQCWPRADDAKCRSYAKGCAELMEWRIQIVGSYRSCRRISLLRVKRILS